MGMGLRLRVGFVGEFDGLGSPSYGDVVTSNLPRMGPSSVARGGSPETGGEKQKVAPDGAFLRIGLVFAFAYAVGSVGVFDGLGSPSYGRRIGSWITLRAAW
ncbi:hypothetical protein-transmembrane prediction [Rhodopirellula baltica SH 1]|uniref:Uncharacterized protein n=1 Tax=Rhodopirellula baltica (strain DSM 10527 / NCIMB 13988 / SH1) TaxID=243090 RepID=Q7UV33_RHOBA|nr:hypothetical protein-transmembrane prediction [Rhodopirellula baltica SH 1]